MPRHHHYLGKKDTQQLANEFHYRVRSPIHHHVQFKYLKYKSYIAKYLSCKRNNRRMQNYASWITIAVILLSIFFTGRTEDQCATSDQVVPQLRHMTTRPIREMLINAHRMIYRRPTGSMYSVKQNHTSTSSKHDLRQ